jgi:hypothetical protein
VLCCQDFARKFFEIKIKHSQPAFAIAPTRMFIGFPQNEGGGGDQSNQLECSKNGHGRTLLESPASNIFQADFHRQQHW